MRAILALAIFCSASALGCRKTPCPDGGDQRVSATAEFEETACYARGVNGVDYHGPYLRRYSSSQIAEQGSYANGQRSGQWHRWYPTGQLKEVTNYEAGEPSGQHLSLFPNGAVQAVGRYVGGKQDGLWQFGAINGVLTETMTYKFGKLEGDYKQWSVSGHLEMHAHYSAGVLHGPFTRWTGACGEVFAVYRHDDQPSGPKIEMRSDKDCRKPERDNQKLEQGAYCYEQRCGKWSIWDPATARMKVVAYDSNADTKNAPSPAP